MNAEPDGWLMVGQRTRVATLHGCDGEGCETCALLAHADAADKRIEKAEAEVKNLWKTLDDLVGPGHTSLAVVQLRTVLGQGRGKDIVCPEECAAAIRALKGDAV